MYEPQSVLLWSWMQDTPNLCCRPPPCSLSALIHGASLADLERYDEMTSQMDLDGAFRFTHRFRHYNGRELSKQEAAQCEAQAQLREENAPDGWDPCWG